MPWYNDLRPTTDNGKQNYSVLFPELTNTDRKRIIKNLLTLRSSLDNKIPQKKNDESLLLCSWNIKEFGHLNKRLPESYFYIAEIVNRYDLIAIQEIKSHLEDLEIIMKLLGSNWKYLITDITEGKKGNRERFAYIYDTRKVEPSGLAGEIVLWEKLTENSTIKQLKRTPAITGFKCGWKKFSIINIHLHPGNDVDDRVHRKKEIELLLKAVEHKIKKKRLWNDNLIILGDTNLHKNNTQAVDLFKQNGFVEVDSLSNISTNVSDTEIYDRIFLNVNEYFKLKKNNNDSDVSGVLDVYDMVFREGDCKTYHEIMKEHKENPTTLVTDDDFLKYYNRYWKRNQISDHNPVWIEIEIDSSDDFLKEKLDKLG